MRSGDYRERTALCLEEVCLQSSVVGVVQNGTFPQWRGEVPSSVWDRVSFVDNENMGGGYLCFFRTIPLFFLEKIDSKYLCIGNGRGGGRGGGEIVQYRLPPLAIRHEPERGVVISKLLSFFSSFFFFFFFFCKKKNINTLPSGVLAMSFQTSAA